MSLLEIVLFRYSTATTVWRDAVLRADNSGICVYMYVCMSVYVYMSVCMYVYVYVCICTYVCVYYMMAYVHIMCTCMYMYIICMCVYVYVYVCMCIYMYSSWLLILWWRRTICWILYSNQPFSQWMTISVCQY